MRRGAAAGAGPGGGENRDPPRASAVATRAAITHRRPTWPVSAIRWPGSGLTAAEVTLARPSGNEIVFLTSDSGWMAANGPTRTANTPIDTAVMIAVARLPSRARA